MNEKERSGHRELRTLAIHIHSWKSQELGFFFIFPEQVYTYFFLYERRRKRKEGEGAIESSGHLPYIYTRGKVKY